MLAGLRPEGRDTLDEAFAFVERTDERYCESELHRLRAEFLLAEGDTMGAETALQNAIEVARGQSARSWELRATTALSRLWLEQGKAAEARQALKAIYEWFSEGFETPDLLDARALLDEFT
jgi:predicted ATPase